ncbi:cilia- and flagella-associated protein 43, partial [Haematococcus lacustris]
GGDGQGGEAGDSAAVLRGSAWPTLWRAAGARSGQAAAQGRLHKSTAHSAVHARPEGVLALSPSHQLLVTGSSDGTISTHTPSLTLVGSLGPSSSSPRGVGSPPSPPAPETRTSASVRAPGVVMPPDLAAITQPGNAVTVAVSQEPQGLMRLAGGLAAWSGGAAAGLHQLAAGGVAAVGFDHSGRFIISAGSDGSLFVYETKGGHHLTRKPSTKMFNPNQKVGPSGRGVNVSLVSTGSDSSSAGTGTTQPSMASTFHRPHTLASQES